LPQGFNADPGHALARAGVDDPTADHGLPQGGDLERCDGARPDIDVRLRLAGSDPILVEIRIDDVPARRQAVELERTVWGRGRVPGDKQLEGTRTRGAGPRWAVQSEG